MFGHQDEDHNHDSNVNDSSSDNKTSDYNDDSQKLGSFNPSPPPADDPSTEKLLTENSGNSPDPSTNALSPDGEYPKPASQKLHSSPHNSNLSDLPNNDTGSDSSDLTLIKHRAISELSPLINELDQTPDERFQTLMMMIQATDNQTLIKSAYDAAQNISDTKARAQALLDIVNEINYFSQAKS